jgi:hypothetical protein
VEHTWKFFEAHTNTTWPGWADLDYDDSPWITGPGAFGLPLDEVVPPPFVLRTVILPPDAGGPITTYFRTKFNLTADRTNAMAQMAGVFDEGAVVYLNSAEVWRVRLPNGPVTTSTLASNAVEPHVVANLNLYAPGLLRAGTNILAVELHQVTPTSGDAVMGLTLRLSSTPLTCLPTLAIARSGGDSVSVSWTCGGTLQVSALPAGPPESWKDIITAGQSFTTNRSAGPLFFRVRLP